MAGSSGPPVYVSGRHLATADEVEYTRDGYAESIREKWIITGCPDVLSGAAQLPAWGTSHPNAPWMTAQSLRCKGAPHTKGMEWEGEVVWSTPNATLIPETQQTEWSFGMVSQHIEQDLEGHGIGYPMMVDHNGYACHKPDEDAKLGYDVQCPTLNITVTMPRAYAFDPALYLDLLGKCNAGTLIIDGWSIPEGYAMYCGAHVAPTPNYPGMRQIQHQFIVGWMKLPETLPIYWAWSHTTYTGPIMMPMCLGVFPAWEPCTPDAGGNLQFDEAGIVRRINHLAVFNAYYIQDMTCLGIV